MCPPPAQANMYATVLTVLFGFISVGNGFYIINAFEFNNEVEDIDDMEKVATSTTVVLLVWVTAFAITCIIGTFTKRNTLGLYGGILTTITCVIYALMYLISSAFLTLLWGFCIVLETSCKSECGPKACGPGRKLTGIKAINARKVESTVTLWMAEEAYKNGHCEQEIGYSPNVKIKNHPLYKENWKQLGLPANGSAFCIVCYSHPKPSEIGSAQDPQEIGSCLEKYRNPGNDYCRREFACNRFRTMTGMLWGVSFFLLLAAAAAAVCAQMCRVRLQIEKDYPYQVDDDGAADDG